MKNILVGVDFDEKTEDLIEKVKVLAKKYGAKLWLLHAQSVEKNEWSAIMSVTPTIKPSGCLTLIFGR